ncbi:MAG: hypothetical protein KDK78_11320, partial [Chlamydiia bacterium]|nr:hypothetical protein [Chlamydiia bacterium]
MTELLVVLLVVLPICQGLVCLFIPKDWARYLGIASSFLSTLLLALVFYFFHLDAQGQTPSVFYPWIPEAMLNLSFHVDGLGIF